MIQYDYELLAWQTGLALAKAEGYVFSDATLAWCDEQLASYVGWEEREVLRWVTPDPSRVYAPDVLRAAYTGGPM